MSSRSRSPSRQRGRSRHQASNVGRNLEEPKEVPRKDLSLLGRVFRGLVPVNVGRVFGLYETLNTYGSSGLRYADLVRALTTSYDGETQIPDTLTANDIVSAVSKARSGIDRFRRTSSSKSLVLEIAGRLGDYATYTPNGRPTEIVMPLEFNTGTGDGLQYFNLFGCFIALFPNLTKLTFQGDIIRSKMDNADSFGSILRFCPNLTELNLNPVTGILPDPRATDSRADTILRKGYNLLARLYASEPILGNDKVTVVEGVVRLFTTYGPKEGKIRNLKRNLATIITEPKLKFLIPIAVFGAWQSGFLESQCAGTSDFSGCQETVKALVDILGPVGFALPSFKTAYELALKEGPPRHYTDLKINGRTVQERFSERGITAGV